MLEFLSWLAIGVIATALILIGGFLYARRLFRRLTRKLVTCGAFGELPAEVRILPGRTAAEELPAARRRETRWLSLGLQESDRWQREVGWYQTRLTVLRHPTDDLLALVASQPELGTWSELYAFDGQEIVAGATNLPDAAGARWLPAHGCIHLPDADEEQLLAALGSRVSNEDSVALAGDELRLSIETQQRRHLASLYLKRDWSSGELRTLLAECYGSTKQDDATAELGLLDLTPAHHRSFETACAWHLVSLCAEEFLRRQRRGVPHWWKEKDRLHVVHDRLDADMLRKSSACGLSEYFRVTTSLKAAMKRQRSQQPFRGQFASVNRRFPKMSRYRLIDTLDWVLPADIYIAP